MEIVSGSVGIIEMEHPVQGIMDVKAAGYENVMLDFDICCDKEDLENCNIRPLRGTAAKKRTELINSDEAYLEYCRDVIAKIKAKGLNIVSARAPFLGRDTKRTDLDEFMMRRAKQSILICEEAKCQYLVVRPLFAGVKSGDEWNVNQPFYLELGREALKRNVKLLLENQAKDCGGHAIKGICSDAAVASEWVDSLNKEIGNECFGFAVNVGVCNLCGQDINEFVKGLGNRVKLVRVSDNNGRDDVAMLPFTAVKKRGSMTDWRGLIRGLRSIEFDGQIVLDMGETSIAFSPILRPEILKVGKSVADYFKWQIEIESLLKKYSQIVLFGAGNMCRNYMACYGKEYPPLFTCDNNPNMWGKTVAGLQVMPPEELKKLSGDYGVFICNIYYRDIEQQLNGMGITNVEYFNDEYLPVLARQILGGGKRDE